MGDRYVHHRLNCEPRQWQAVADALKADGAKRLAGAGGVLFGAFRSQIGAPRDELNVITAWPDGRAVSAAEAEALLLEGVTDVRTAESLAMTPTLRPDSIDPPRRQGNFAFRWFETPAHHWAEFLALCEGAWPGFEASYDSQVVGLWRIEDAAGEAGLDTPIRSLLLTRRPDLAMWERSKLPASAEEAEVRRKLSRRYDLCDWTTVFTTTLLTAEDKVDKARWA
jgi:hypothetical protein